MITDLKLIRAFFASVGVFMDLGAIVDVETTGLNPKEDKIIEIGLIIFGVQGNDGPMVVHAYGGLQDPGMVLDPKIIKITGIKDEYLKGQKIDWVHVRSWLEKVSIVIAHNADFDRSFLHGVSELRDLKLHWGCSQRHIDWRKHGFASLALNYLAADHGFVNPFAHRALFDCATTMRLISPYLEELTKRSYERQIYIKAVGAAYESKDLLRSRGYQWDPNERVWSRMVFASDLEEERRFLASDVYRGRSHHVEAVQEVQ
jgi:DNA polymerase-3 subunit epsilon